VLLSDDDIRELYEALCCTNLNWAVYST